MRDIVREKLYNVVYSPLDNIELFVSVIKLVWGCFLIFNNTTFLFDNVFFFIDTRIISTGFGVFLSIAGMLKLWAWLSDKLWLRKRVALMGMCGWLFLLVSTQMTVLPKFSMIQFMVLMLSDFWLFLRLGALRNDKSSTD